MHRIIQKWTGLDKALNDILRISTEWQTQLGDKAKRH